MHSVDKVGHKEREESHYRMKTQIFNEKELSIAAQKLKDGQLVAFPTETVYGLGADATNATAVKQVYEAKGRPSDNPLIVHVSDADDLLPFIDTLTPVAQKLIHYFWPGPLTLIFDLKKQSLPPEVTGGLSTAAFRMPDHPLTREVIRLAGIPLVGPSANTSGKPSPTSSEHVLQDLDGKITGVIEGGPTKIGLESTVLDVSEEVPVILRPGAITKEDLEAVIGPVRYDSHLIQENQAPKAPGMKYKHYAPSIPVYMIDNQKQDWQEALDWAKEKRLRVGLLASQNKLDVYQTQADQTYCLSQEGDVVESMQQLFAGLRFFDAQTPKVDLLFVETFSESIAKAYMNRLKKAANGHYWHSQVSI